MDWRAVEMDSQVKRAKGIMEIKNIIFDLGGVLVSLDQQRCIDALNKIGVNAIARYVKERRTEDLFYDAEIGEITQHEFCEEVRRITGTRTSDEDIVWAWNQLLGDISEERKLRLWKLKQQGFRLFLLSNTNVMHWQYCAEELFPYRNRVVEDYFERVFLSFEMHQAKPDSEIFEHVLAEAGINASETLFIDDSEANCQAAESLGIHTYYNMYIDDWMKL